MKPKKSQRFNPSALTSKLVPVLLVLILMGLVVVLVIIGMTILGFTPGA